MVPGSLTAAGEWSEASSLAREIEQQMIGQELINLDDETEEATDNRRRTFIAISTAVINHLTSSLEISLQAGDLRGGGEANARLLRTARDFAVAAGRITINVGDLRPTNDAGTPIPLTAKTLTGKVR